MLKKLSVSIFSVLLVFPFVAGAGGGVSANGFLNLIGSFQTIIDRLIPFAIAIALLLFLFGILRYMVGKDGVDKDEAKKFMIWGIVMLFVMVSVWGIVNILSETIFPEGTSDTAPTTPKAPSVNIR